MALHLTLWWLCRSLSYKIPTLVSEAWARITEIVNRKQRAIPLLLQSIDKELRPLIEEVIHDVTPIIKLLYNAVGYGSLSGMGREDIHEDVHPHSAGHKARASVFGHGYDGDDDSWSESEGDEMHKKVGIRHFPLIRGMKEFCLTESRLYEYFLAFENLAIDQVFGDVHVVTGSSQSSLGTTPRGSAPHGPSGGRHRDSFDFSRGRLPQYEYVELLRYEYGTLQRSSSSEFAERIEHIERIHHQITLILCEIVYATLKCTMKCVGELVLYKDQLEEKWLSCGKAFDQDVISGHEVCWDIARRDPPSLLRSEQHCIYSGCTAQHVAGQWI